MIKTRNQVLKLNKIKLIWVQKNAIHDFSFQKKPRTNSLKMALQDKMWNNELYWRRAGDLRRYLQPEIWTALPAAAQSHAHIVTVSIYIPYMPT